MVSQDIRETARKRVDAKIGFYVHLFIYIVVNILLVILNLKYSPQYHWFYWPLSGWGIGIFFHAMAVFVFPPGSAIKEKMMKIEEKKLMRDDK
jgi:hypothetical protein